MDIFVNSFTECFQLLFGSLYIFLICVVLFFLHVLLILHIKKKERDLEEFKRDSTQDKEGL